MLGEKFHRESNEDQMQSNFEVTGAAADHTLANPGPTLGQPWANLGQSLAQIPA